VQCLTALKHPSIIRLAAHIDLARYVVLAFELAEGGDMFKHLCRLPQQRISEEEVCVCVVK
jgi:hypothetical protein